MSGRSRSTLIFAINEMKVSHNKEMEKMKRELLKEKKKVKGLEDKFGVTQRRRWGIRQRKWWLTWLSNNDTDAYEYLMKTIHKTLLYGGDSLSLRKGKQGLLTQSKRELNHVRANQRKVCDKDINIYGMRLNSATHWWHKGDPVISQLLRQQTKNDLITCCKENEIKYKKSWSKKVFIGLLINHNAGEHGGERVEEDVLTELSIGE